MHTPIVADEYPGHTVLSADGDDLGIVTELLTEAVAEPYLVIRLAAEGIHGLESEHVYVPSHAVAAVTERDVVLGTTTAWLEPHDWTTPPTSQPA